MAAVSDVQSLHTVAAAACLSPGSFCPSHPPAATATGRDHLHWVPLPAQLSGCRGTDARAWDHRFVRERLVLAPQVRAELHRRYPLMASPAQGHLAPPYGVHQDGRSDLVRVAGGGYGVEGTRHTGAGSAQPIAGRDLPARGGDRPVGQLRSDNQEGAAAG